MVYRSTEDVNVEERTVSLCRLSQLVRVTNRRMERTNDRLDVLHRSMAAQIAGMEARAVARDAETAAGVARLNAFRQIQNPTHEDVLAFLAQSNRKGMQ